MTDKVTGNVDSSNRRRFSGLKLWFATTYVIWSSFIYLSTLGHDGHAWWPVFLFPLALPVYLLEKLGLFELLRTPNDMVKDYLAGVFYIVGGTIWNWFLGYWVGRLLNRVFPPKS